MIAANTTIAEVKAEVLKLELPEGGFRLEKGGVLPAIEVCYERSGNLEAAPDNVVFICHALTGDAHVVGTQPGESEPSGWWEGMVGPGKGIDTNHYQVICANILGGCKGTTGPASINPATGKPYGSTFPKITVGDIVEVHRMLLQQLGIKRLALVVGGSFGGMQVLEWLIRYSTEIDKAVIIASAASLSTQALAFDILGRHAITEDPNWNSGDYYDREHPTRGLASARKLAHITYLSQQLMENKFGREKRHEWLQAGRDFHSAVDRNFGTFFQIESYLQHQGRKFIRRFDANSYLHITLAMDEYDIEERYGTLEQAFAGITSRILVVALSDDWLFTPEQSTELVSALVKQRKRVSYFHLNSTAGHDAFLTHIDELSEVMRAFTRPSNAAKDAQDLLLARRTTIWNWQVRRYRQILDLVPEKSRVLDLGCGSGTLLNILRDQRACQGTGVEIELREAIAAIGKGCDVLLEDIDHGLGMLAGSSFDLVLLSETLQAIKRPKQLLAKIFRIAPEAIIIFPNFGCLEVRRELLLKGRMPKGKQLPFEWYDTPNIHLFTLKDFLVLCREDGYRLVELICNGRGLTERLLLSLGLRNLGASSVIAKIARLEETVGQAEESE